MPDSQQKKEKELPFTVAELIQLYQDQGGKLNILSDLSEVSTSFLRRVRNRTHNPSEVVARNIVSAIFELNLALRDEQESRVLCQRELPVCPSQKIMRKLTKSEFQDLCAKRLAPVRANQVSSLNGEK